MTEPLDLNPIKRRLAALNGVRDMFTDDESLTQLVRDDIQALLNELDAERKRFLATLPIYERMMIAAILDTTLPSGWRLELNLDDYEETWERSVRIHVPTEGSWTLCYPRYHWDGGKNVINGWRLFDVYHPTIQEFVDPLIAARTPRHDPTVTRTYDENGCTATISCSCDDGWSRTITDTVPIPPRALTSVHRHHKANR